jgi:hypothetical protein
MPEDVQDVFGWPFLTPSTVIIPPAPGHSVREYRAT